MTQEAGGANGGKAQRRLENTVLSDLMRRKLDLIRRATNLEIPVLLTGETGTGKGTIARLVHDEVCGPRKPFVHVNLGALPRDLVESQLFGHERGAFTGADKTNLGAFQAARGGTIFLDEIGDMPVDQQVKLLHVLEEGLFYRLGGSWAEIELSCRIIAATSCDLERLVSNGKFRSELLFRLSRFPVEVPPLRERLDEIGPICDRLLARLSEISGEQRVFGEGVIELLRAHSWPGNIRELENAVTAAWIRSDGPEIPPDAFQLVKLSRPAPERERAPADRPRLAMPDDELDAALLIEDMDKLPPYLTRGIIEWFMDRAPDGGVRLLEAEAAMRRVLYWAAMNATDGNKSRAAQLLGVKRTTLVAMARRTDGMRGVSDDEE